MTSVRGSIVQDQSARFVLCPVEVKTESHSHFERNSLMRKPTQILQRDFQWD